MAVTKTELKSSFLEQELESEEYQKSVKNIQDWLTGQTQLAQQQYQQTAQTAATQASYDISGAYANYLKQQRSVAAQGQLETGYKQEVGDILQEQYKSAYSQAKATETQAIASAAEKTSKLYEQAALEATSMTEQLLSQYQKQAEMKTNLFAAGEEFALSKGSDSFPWYSTNKETGETTITPWGVEQFKSSLLQYGDEFKTYLEEKGLEDELAYYLSMPTTATKELFGFEDTEYGISDESKQATKDAKLQTAGYADIIEKPKYVQQSSYHGDFTQMTNALSQYANDLGLTEDEIKKVLGRPIQDIVNDFGLEMSEYQERLDVISKILLKYSNYKYGHVENYETLDKDYYKKKKEEEPPRIAWFNGSNEPMLV